MLMECLHQKKEEQRYEEEMLQLKQPPPPKVTTKDFMAFTPGEDPYVTLLTFA